MIPRILHQVWVPPGGQLPRHLAKAVQSWRDLHPDWTFRLWGDADLGWLEHRDLYDAAPDLVPADAVGQLRADIARYELLAEHGGLYTDVDTVALRPVDDALTGHDAFAAAEDPTWVGNTYLGCASGHPVMRDLVAGLRTSVGRADGRLRPNRLTGPRYLTPIWRRHGCHVAPRRLFYPYSYSHVKAGNVPSDFGDAYAVHLWSHTRQVLEGRQR